jgi:hypothetical protein
MNHDEALQQRATEKYLLDELDPTLRDQFEEHLFDCQECALDVRAAAMFVEQTKVVLAEPSADEVRVPVVAAAPQRVPQRGWLAWLRPAFAAPVLAMLLAVVGYQSYLLRSANEPQIASWASVNVNTRAGTHDVEPIAVKTSAGAGFNLLVNVTPDLPGSTSPKYNSYTLELYNPVGRLQWSGRIPPPSPDDLRSIFVPGGELAQGKYTLTIHKIWAKGEDIENHPIEVQIQK